MVKNPPANAYVTDVGSILGSGRCPTGGHGNPLQCSCLENPMDREAWQATVHRVTQSPTPLKQLSMHAHAWASTHTHTHTYAHLFPLANLDIILASLA